MVVSENNFKSRLLAIVLSVVLIFGFIAPLNFVNADDTDYTFEMVSGASVRKVAPYGIKFSAKIGKDLYDSVDNFYFIIVPVAFINKYVTSTENVDYYAVLSSSPYDIAIVKAKSTLKDDGYYYASASIVDILYKNLTRKFWSIAYYTDNSGVRHYADFTEGNNVRSIAQVASSALNGSESFTEEQNNYLNDTVSNARLLQLGYSENRADKTLHPEKYTVNFDLVSEDDKPKIVPTNAGVLTSDCTFSSSNNSVATIDEEGIITEGNAGIAVITCVALGVSYEFNYVVTSSSNNIWSDVSGDGSYAKLTLKDGASIATDAVVYVPSFFGGKPVKSIKEYSLQNTSVSKIYFSDFIVEIEKYAFRSTTIAGALILPENLTKLYYSAFNNCTQITSVVLPSKIEEIQGYAFTSVPIKNVVFPKSLQKINAFAFSKTSLEYAEFLSPTSWTATKNGTTVTLNLSNCSVNAQYLINNDYYRSYNWEVT